MSTNPYFKYNVRSEQNLYEDILIESIKMYGQDVYYVPRATVKENRIFGEEIPAKYNSAYVIEMYIEDVNGFAGGDLFTKFGIEVRDQATFVVSKRRWAQTVARFDNDITIDRPAEGDLLYIPLTGDMFQIMSVETEEPFYQVSNLPTYKLKCEMFEYSDEKFSTNVDEIDEIERDYSYTYHLYLDSAGPGFNIGDIVTQTLTTGIIMSGEVSGWAESDNILSLIHIGANDGKYHEFVGGLLLMDANSNTVLVNTVTEEDRISPNEQNIDFAQDAGTFLDFTESNPFGDPEVL